MRSSAFSSWGAASRQEAEEKVREFHALLNDSRFDEIYDGGGAELHKAATRSDFKNLLAAVRRKLGKVVTTANKGWGVKTFNMTTYVNLVQETHFETGQGTETFIFVVRNGLPALVGYNINSNDLITR